MSLDGLSSSERHVVQDASVLGKTFTKEAVAAIARCPSDELDVTLAALVRKEVLGIQAERHSPERGQYVFQGDLVRWVAYETLPKKERASRHLAAARWLERHGDEDTIELVAGHYRRAYEAEPSSKDAEIIRDQAVAAMKRAGERAARLGASGEGRRHFAHAAELASSELERAELIERCGQMASKEGEEDEARALFAEAISLFESQGAVHPAARVSARLADVDWREVRLDEAISRMETAFGVLRGDQQDRDLGMLAAQLGRMRFFKGDMEAAAEVIELALRIGEAKRLPDVTGPAMNTKGSWPPRPDGSKKASPFSAMLSTSPLTTTCPQTPFVPTPTWPRSPPIATATTTVWSSTHAGWRCRNGSETGRGSGRCFRTSCSH
jgi:hypothetical protein